jgi:ABC-type nickel/cobalt efflux system permease component RcnA
VVSVLFLGFLIGMQHALEADHVAAVAAIATRGRSIRRIVRHGAIWGLGHSLALLVFGGGVLMLGTAVPAGLARGLELAVGVMLLLLGAGVLHRLIRERVHFHRHRHGDGVVHLHAHSHAGERRAHDPAHHTHAHPDTPTLRSLLVGMVHGMAGSAALLVLALSTIQSTLTGLLYIALFGCGSVVGMAALSAVIAVPLSYSARLLTWMHQVLQGAVGGVTLMIGAVIVYRTGF